MDKLANAAEAKTVEAIVDRAMDKILEAGKVDARWYGPLHMLVGAVIACFMLIFPLLLNKLF